MGTVCTLSYRGVPKIDVGKPNFKLILNEPPSGLAPPKKFNG